MFRRVIFGPLTNPANEKLQDLNGREILLLVPILVLILVMGIYPQPFLQRMKPAVELVIAADSEHARQACVRQPQAERRVDDLWTLI